MATQKIAVIGLGSFGLPLAERLTEQGVEVLAIDANQERVELLRDKVANAVVMDTTDISALKQLELYDFDAVVVAIGDSFESSILTTAHLQELKVPRIINRTLSPIHERLLKLMGVDELIVPEGEAAAQLARKIALKGVLEHFDISREYSIVEIELPAWAQGKKLKDLDLRRKHQLNLITVLNIQKSAAEEVSTGKKAHKTSRGIPDEDMQFQLEDVLVVFGKNTDIQKFLSIK